MASCTTQLSGLGDVAATSLCRVVGKINANFNDAAAAIRSLEGMTQDLERSMAQREARERQLEEQLRQPRLTPQQRDRLQKELQAVKEEKAEQAKSLGDLRTRMTEYSQLQGILDAIREGTEGLRRKVSSIPIDDGAAGGRLGLLDRGDEFRAGPRRPPQYRRPGQAGGYRPVRRPLKRDVLGRVLPKTALSPRPRSRASRASRAPYSAAQSLGTNLPYRPRRGRAPSRTRASRRSGITPNVPDWKRQVAEQQQAAARLRRARS